MLQDIPSTSFIAQYPSEDKELWSHMRSWADQSWDRTRSSTLGQAADPSVKDSWDSTLNSRPELQDKYRSWLDHCLSQYRRRFQHVPTNLVLEYPTMLSHFPPGGAFHRLHCERAHRGSNRVLVYMTYLTSHQGEGYTEFPSWSLKIEPQEGLTLIWPADWPWTHRGLPAGQDKYIATGWWVFA